jgi:hypothetical protein
MTAHTAHTALDGYDERQIFFDGCKECEWRGDDPSRALDHMDSKTFRRALRRAIEWQTDTHSYNLNLSQAEIPVLEILWKVALQMSRSGLAEFDGVRA